MHQWVSPCLVEKHNFQHLISSCNHTFPVQYSPSTTVLHLFSNPSICLSASICLPTNIYTRISLHVVSECVYFKVCISFSKTAFCVARQLSLGSQWVMWETRGRSGCSHGEATYKLIVCLDAFVHYEIGVTWCVCFRILKNKVMNIYYITTHVSQNKWLSSFPAHTSLSPHYLMSYIWKEYILKH